VIRVDKTGLDIPVMCVQCIKPKCVEACPEGAIWKDDDGIVRINEGECVGCRICSEACIIGAIKVDPNSEIPLICNLCDGKPKCVEWCATKALRFSSTTESTNQFSSTTESTNQKWLYVLAHSKKNVEKWKLPQETLEHVEKMVRGSE